MTQTDTQLLDQFLAELLRQEVSSKTLESYRLDLALFARWFESTNGERFAPEAITRSDIRDYKAHLLTVERRKPATINRRLAALRRFFLWAQAAGYTKELPTERVKGVSATPPPPKSLEKREVDRLIRAVERHGNRRDLAILNLLRHTGVRVGELCSLRLSDVHMSERKGELIIRSGKGARFRSVPLNVEARRSLEAYLEVRPKVAPDSLFIGQRGEGLKPRAVELVVAKYAGLVGLEEVTPHTLRHSFGKHTLDAGANLATVAHLMGHQNIKTTAIYTSPHQKDLELAVDRLASE